MSEADDRFAIIEVLDRYADVLDTRDWQRLDLVFAPDVEMDFGAWRVRGIDAVRSRIRSYLDGCGPSQHLLGNYRIELDPADRGRARSRCKIRVMHLGRGAHAGETYEMMGEYRDELARTPDGWRITKRDAIAQLQLGNPGLLGPGER